MIHTILETMVLLIKRRVFTVDRRIPSSYLIGLIFSKACMALRGALRLRRVTLAFVGAGVTLKGKGNFHFGSGLVIDRGAYIDALSIDGISFGTGVSVQRGVVIECTGSLAAIGKGLIVGNNVGIGSGSFLGCAGGIEIGEDTIIGNFVTFHSENHNFSDGAVPIRSQGVSREGISIGRNCWIGAKATVLDGAVIEDGCVIAAGAVVRAGLYERDSIYGGVPAKLIRSRIADVGHA